MNNPYEHCDQYLTPVATACLPPHINLILVNFLFHLRFSESSEGIEMEHWLKVGYTEMNIWELCPRKQ